MPSGYRHLYLSSHLSSADTSGLPPDSPESTSFSGFIIWVPSRRRWVPHTTPTAKPTTPHSTATASPQTLSSHRNSDISLSNWHLLYFRLFYLPVPLVFQPRDLQFLTIHPLLSLLSSLLSISSTNHHFSILPAHILNAPSTPSFIQLWQKCNHLLPAFPDLGTVWKKNKIRETH